MKKHAWLIIIVFAVCIVGIMVIRTSKEAFSNNNNNDNSSVSVDMPLTSTTTCNNFCGPTAKCAMTGTQCSSDPDCSGCSIPSSSNLSSSKEVVGDNDAGKMSSGVGLNYSTLTSGYGTREKRIKGRNEKPPQANFGANTWRHSFNEGQKLYLQRYDANDHTHYPLMYSVTGEFSGHGPRPANY